MPRLSMLSRETLTADQMRIHDRIAQGPRGTVRGPFALLLHSPELAGHVEQLGSFVRYRCSVPERQRELAILVVGAHWHCAYEWHAHARLALAQGVPQDILSSIAVGERPAFADRLDAIVHDFATESLKMQRVSDATFEAARAALGEQGAVDLAGLIGYYTLLAITLNTFEVDAPDGQQPPW